VRRWRKSGWWNKRRNWRGGKRGGEVKKWRGDMGKCWNK